MPRWLDALGEIERDHALFAGSVQWRLTARGIQIDGTVTGTPGPPETVRRVWSWYGEDINRAAAHYGVPAELLVATICTEAAGGAKDRDATSIARREEPGYIDENRTPGKVSSGCMQTLLATAREMLGDPMLSAHDLTEPEVSIAAGAAYIAHQSVVTAFDPPLVAAAYNAGNLYVDPAPANRWRLRCYPIGTGAHVDRFVAWFNDAMDPSVALLASDAPSFAAAMQL